MRKTQPILWSHELVQTPSSQKHFRLPLFLLPLLNPVRINKPSNIPAGNRQCPINSVPYSITKRGLLSHVLPMWTLWVASGFSVLNRDQMVLLSIIRHTWLLRVIVRNMVLTILTHSTLLLSQLQSSWSFHLPFPMVGVWDNLTSTTHSSMATWLKLCTCDNHQVLKILPNHLMYAAYTRPFMGLSNPHVHGSINSSTSLSPTALLHANMIFPSLFTLLEAVFSTS